MNLLTTLPWGWGLIIVLFVACLAIIAWAAFVESLRGRR